MIRRCQKVLTNGIVCNFRFNSHFILVSLIKLSRLLNVARMSVYDASYIEPTVTRDLLTEDIAEEDYRRFSKIKAAKSNESVSMIYDKDIE